MEVLRESETETVLNTEERLASGTKEPETPFLDIALVLLKAKKRVLQVTLVGLLLGAAIALAIKPNYSAKAIIMPPQAPQSSLSSLMGQLGSLSALGGGASSLLKNPADLYVGILQSRSVSDRAIQSFHLQTLWHIKSMDDARKTLDSHVQFEAAKDGLIEITVTDKDPKRASDLANFFVDSLNGINSTLAITEASQRRLFFEQQLAEEKNALANAEEDLKNTQQKTGLISPSGQSDLAVRNVAQTQTLISRKEVELQSMRAYATAENPDVVRLQREIETMRGQLTELENNESRQAPGDTQISANQLPVGSLDYVRKLREVKYHDTLFDLLSRQYEAARIDEAKSAPIIQVVDRAVVPDKKSGPPRLLITIGIGLIGFCLACGWAFLQNANERARQVPELSSKLDALEKELSWPRF